MIKVGFSKTDLEKALLPREWYVREERIEAISFCIESEKTRAIWIILDFMDFNRKVTDTLKSATEKKTGISREHIHIVTTHNHGGGEPDCRILAELVADGAMAAMNAAKPAEMRYVFTRVDKQVNYIRRVYIPEIEKVATVFFGTSEKTGYDSAPFVERFMEFLKKGDLCYSGGIETKRPFNPLPSGDDELVAIQFRDACGVTIGSVVRFAAHAVCCNRDGSFSSDYPFYVRRRMEKEFGGIAAFMNGPCGDIAPGLIDKYEGTERTLGEYLAEIAITAIEHLPFETIEGFDDAEFEIRLPVRREVMEGRVTIDDDLPEDLKKRYEYLDKKSLGGLMNFLREKYTEGEETVNDEISVFMGFLRIGDMVFAGFPGETFSVTGVALQQAFPGLDICTVTEHGRTVMYLPPEADCELGSYESVCKTTARNGEEVLRTGAIGALESFLDSQQV